MCVCKKGNFVSAEEKMELRVSTSIATPTSEIASSVTPTEGTESEAFVMQMIHTNLQVQPPVVQCIVLPGAVLRLAESTWFRAPSPSFPASPTASRRPACQRSPEPKSAGA